MLCEWVKIGRNWWPVEWISRTQVGIYTVDAGTVAVDKSVIGGWRWA